LSEIDSIKANSNKRFKINNISTFIWFNLKKPTPIKVCKEIKPSPIEIINKIDIK